MKINLYFNKEQKEIFNSIIKECTNKELSIDKLYNVSSYLKEASKYINNLQNNNIINNNNNIIQAIKYKNDNYNIYWILLTNDYIFYDIMIPLNSDDIIIEKLDENEKNIIKILLDY
jgi:hypothetical protein